jgi:hypothetical protein
MTRMAEQGAILLVLPLMLCCMAAAGLCQAIMIHPKLSRVSRSFDNVARSGFEFRSVMAGFDEDGDPFQACWQSTTFSVNPLDDPTINRVLQCLCSPAPQSYYVIQRALQKTTYDQHCRPLRSILGSSTASSTVSDDDNVEVDIVGRVFALLSYLLKPGYQFAVRDGNVSCAQYFCPGKDWTILRVDEVADGWARVSSASKSLESKSTLEIAQDLLNYVIHLSDTRLSMDAAINYTFIDELVMGCEEKLALTLGTDVRGRKAADAAFTLALAGVDRQVVFEVLAQTSYWEILRVQNRHSSSVNARGMLHMVEKLAASGYRSSQSFDKVCALVARSLRRLRDRHVMEFPDIELGWEDHMVLSGAGGESFDMLSSRPLLWLWRFTAKQKKPHPGNQGQIQPVASHGKFSPRNCMQQFNDATRPLVLDLGCGLGVSLLGLASLGRDARSRDLFLNQLGVDLTQSNFLGCDLSLLNVRFARTMASRWSMSGRLQYALCSATDVLEFVGSSYPGSTCLILLQFPTPYALRDIQNSDPPASTISDFMVSPSTMTKISRLIQLLCGYLLIQSNCEDVAVVLRRWAEDANLKPLRMSNPASLIDTSRRTSQRSEHWISVGGERPVGTSWSATPLLPERCRTETEVACQLQANSSVHRCILGYRHSES